MTHRLFLLICALLLFCTVLSSTASADNSHARIVRLSLVQGDVRFAPSFHDDPLTDANAGWQAAPLNLPIRQGYVVATDNGRAEVEFENGAMMFLGANTVVEFYDLSLRDGDRITRLVLRQGTSTVYVNPSNNDYFSVTGGDFTVEAAGRTTFRLDNFDDGSTVNIERGHANVLRDKKSTPLDKGQSLSVQAGNSAEPVIGRVADTDDFDRWVSGRVDSVVTATNYSSQYVNSPNYSAGFADLYTYGSWFPMGGGYGYCWQPFGVGLGWSPFSYGGWYQDPFFGNTFIGSAPWGWLPYHYGGWIFSPIYGWVWAPSGFGFGGPVHYRPATAVWVRNGGTLGIVPLHPGDKPGKTAQNLSKGIFPVQNSQIAHSTLAAGTEKWSVLKKGPTEVISSNLAASTPPSRVSRTVVSGAAGTRVVMLGRDSSISYDPREHRYVNNGNSHAASASEVRTDTARTEGTAHTNGMQPASNGSNGAVVQGATSTRMPARPGTPGSPAVPQAPASASARAGTPSRAPAVPAPARSGGSSSSGGSFSSGGSSWGGGSRSGGGSMGSSAGSSGHPSSTGGGGGGHPH